jgi:hypothetical protein
MSEQSDSAAAVFASTEEDRVKVVYIAGFYRSGTTILDRTFGSLELMVSTGELLAIWRQKLGRIPGLDYYCSCGHHIDRCDFWNAVFATAFGAESAREIVAIENYLYPLLSKRRLPALLWPALLSPADRRGYTHVVEALGRFYKALAHVSGAEVIVDSSKAPRYAYLLARVPQIDLRVVHMVRDSRAVAYSHSRPKPNPRTGGQTMTRGFLRCALDWDVINLMVEIGPLSRLPYRTCIRYEEFVRAPEPTLRRALQELGLSAYDALAEWDDYELAPGHLCFGNVMRHQSGRMSLNEDTVWQTRLPKRQRWLVAAMSWPLLRRYGYPLL